MKYIFIVFLLTGFTAIQGQEKTGSQCSSEPYIDHIYTEDVYRQLQDFTESFILDRRLKEETVTDTVILKLHMIRQSDGSGQGATPEEVQADIDSVNGFFSGADIIFKIHPEINYIDDDSLFDWTNGDDNELLFSYGYCPFAVNAYLTGTVRSGDREVGGIGSGLGNQQAFVVVKYDYLGDGELMAHELGHVFHLRHTHGKYNFDLEDCGYDAWDDEFISDEVWCQGAVIYDDNETLDLNGDGIGDCLQTGDDICDTRAEPNLLYADFDACTYIDPATDPNGDLYNPDVGNIMSYGPCQDHFTTGQFAKIRFAYENYGLHLMCGGCEPFTDRTVTNSDNTGPGSLRWALECAARQEEAVTINFELEEPDSTTIRLETQFHTVGSNTVINGYSQNGDRITVDGSQIADDYSYGLHIKGDSVEVNGLILKGFTGAGILSYYGYEKLLIRDVSVESCDAVGINLQYANDVQILDAELSSNTNMGIYLRDCEDIIIKGCLIDSNGSTGVYMDSCRKVVFGDSQPGDANTATRNAYNGLTLANGSREVRVLNSYFGTDENQTGGLGNVYNGITVDNSSSLSLGQEGSGNLISGNGYAGIVLLNNTQDVNIEANNITGNQGNGIYIDSSSYITVGGQVEALSNIISDNSYSGIFINELSHDIDIYGNFIGTDKDLAPDLGNNHNGILIKNSHDVNVGRSGVGNIITGSSYTGIQVYEASWNVEIEANDISNNSGNAMYIDSSYQLTIGGAESGSGNILSSSGYSGLSISNYSHTIEVQNNYIGTDPSESLLGNTYNGIEVGNSSDIAIGAAGAGNMIAANNYDGIYIYETSENISVQGNLIGTNKDGSMDMHNGYAGIRVDSASHVTIGGETADEINIIGYNASSIEVKDHSDHYLIKRNSLFCSDWGVYFSNLPGAPAPPGDITVTGAYTVTGTAPDEAEVWVYRSDSGCSSCEGKYFIGHTISEGGVWELNLDNPVELNDVITAMTSLDSNSSMFAACVTVDLIPVAIKDEDLSVDWSIYPNPASTFLYISLSSKSPDLCQLKIFNVTGEMVLHSRQLEAENEVAIGYLPAGIYLVILRDGENMNSKKFIITK